MNDFQVSSVYEPAGDQPEAIRNLTAGIQKQIKKQVLLGVTGSGKTFTMAKIIEKVQMPTLIMAPNKTLAAQLYSELKDFFPGNRVEYFVSYYDYYQPEAYVPSKDLYIEKDADINEEIERMRQSTVRSLIERKDVIVVSSVSCIYGWQEPADYKENVVSVYKGMLIPRNELIRSLIKIQYERNDMDFKRGTLRVRGDIVDVYPAEVEQQAIRMQFLGDQIEQIYLIDPFLGKKGSSIDSFIFFQAKQFVTTQERLLAVLPKIREEMEERIQYFKLSHKYLEAERLEQRTTYDLEILEATGTCSGVENYSRHLAKREAGSTPTTIIDYFTTPFLLFIDESHITVPQIRGMYQGDHSRKQNLVDFGFRLPSALDNRPLNGEEFEKKIDFTIYVSATPASYEKSISGNTAEQVIRPTGLVDPLIEVRKTENQVGDLLLEINACSKKGERVLVTTLTKRMSEDLSYYFLEHGIKAKYLHSDIDTIQRVEILKDLRNGTYDTVVGINLLREGLDLPEVSLVAIMDADKEGFLRSHTSLIQTIGRAARNINGKVIMYADRVTDSMKEAIAETDRRRKKQLAYNQENRIEPESIKKAVKAMIEIEGSEDKLKQELKDHGFQSRKGMMLVLRELEEEMHEKAEMLEFEAAAKLRDRIKKIKTTMTDVVSKELGHD
jgi:excinuclease ABC subunit B